MVGSANETVFSGLIEIVLEGFVDERGALGGFYYDEAHGGFVYHGVAQGFPVYLALIVGDVDALYLVALGIGGIAIEGSPAEACGPYEEIVEGGEIDRGNEKSSHPPFP